MRDIKCRAWDKQTKSMVYVLNITFNFESEDGLLVSGYDDKTCNHEIFPEALELMEYIGSEDKNNKKIFECDYVLCRRYPLNPENYLVLIEDIRTLPRELFGSELISREVVGNKYENPDMVLKFAKGDFNG